MHLLWSESWAGREAERKPSSVLAVKRREKPGGLSGLCRGREDRMQGERLGVQVQRLGYRGRRQCQWRGWGAGGEAGMWVEMLRCG